MIQIPEQTNGICGSESLFVHLCIIETSLMDWYIYAIGYYVKWNPRKVLMDEVLYSVVYSLEMVVW